jgi:Zn-dependent protease
MSGFSIGRIFGIELRVHPSWFVIALLILWMLSAVALPSDFPEMAGQVRLLMAGTITLFFFASLLAHELAHSVVAMTRGIPVHRITFFLFGGMAHTSTDSRSAGEEFAIAVAGPVMSLLLAGLFFAVWWLAMTGGWGLAVAGGAAYLTALNLILAVFNLLPGFPMDGGRILRSAIWAITGDVTRATRWASRVGVWMAVLLMGWGGWRAVQGDYMAGLWMVLIGLFVRNAARMSYRQHLVSRVQDVVQRSWEAGYHHRPPGLTGRDVTPEEGGARPDV